MRTLDTEFERDRSIGLGSTIGDAQTDRHTHTDIFSKTHFYFRATLGVKELLQSSKNSTSIFFMIFSSTSLAQSKNVF